MRVINSLHRAQHSKQVDQVPIAHSIETGYRYFTVELPQLRLYDNLLYILH